MGEAKRLLGSATPILGASPPHQDSYGEALYYTGLCALQGATSYGAVRRVDDLMLEVRGRVGVGAVERGVQMTLTVRVCVCVHASFRWQASHAAVLPPPFRACAGSALWLPSSAAPLGSDPATPPLVNCCQRPALPH